MFRSGAVENASVVQGVNSFSSILQRCKVVQISRIPSGVIMPS